MKKKFLFTLESIYNKVMKKKMKYFYIPNILWYVLYGYRCEKAQVKIFEKYFENFCNRETKRNIYIYTQRTKRVIEISTNNQPSINVYTYIICIKYIYIW